MNARNHKEYTISGFDSMQATLATQRQPPPLLLAPVGDNTVELDFDGGRLSSDAGLILLKDSAVVFWRIPNELSSRHGWLLLGE
jgi:hypothetical protein